MRLSASETQKKSAVAESPEFLRLAERKLTSPRVRDLLQSIMDICSNTLKPCVAHAVQEFEQQLLKLSERSQSNDQQLRCAATLQEVKRTSDAIPHRFMLAIENGLARMGEQTPALSSTVSTPHLALLVEDNGEVLKSSTLHELGYRFAVLVGIPVLDADTLPVGPTSISEALRYGVNCLDISPNHRAMLFRIFDRLASNQAQAFYQKLNNYLIDQGILRHLQLTVPGSTQPAEVPAANSSFSASSAQSDKAALSIFYNLLAKRRIALGVSLPTNNSEDYLASEEELQLVLSTLQVKPIVPMVLGGRMVPRTVTHLKQDILNQLRPFATANHPPRLREEDSNLIDLTGMLFDSLAKHIHSNGSGNGHIELLLVKLQIPILRIALRDTSFFLHCAHPARHLLNLIAEAGKYWLGNNEETDYSLLEKLQIVVDKLNNEFNGNITLFEELASDLARHLATLLRKAEISERRHVDAAKGKEKLDMARIHARNAIIDRLKTSSSSLLSTLLEHAWTDVLALTLLRHGENSEEYSRRLKVMDWLLTQDAARKNDKPLAPSALWLQEELEIGLTQIGYHSQDIQSLMDKLLVPVDPSELDEESPTSQTELTIVLKSQARLGEDNPETRAFFDSSSKSSGMPLTEVEQKMRDHLKNLPFGTWFEFVLSNQSDTVRRKLAWFSHLTGQCLFVNLRGVRMEGCTMDTLAREVAKGRALIVVEPERKSLVDHAWSAVSDGLKEFD